MATAQTILARELQEYERQLCEIVHEAKEMLKGVTDKQMLQRPSPSQWCVAECLHHLNLTAEESLVLVDACMVEANQNRWYSDGPFHCGWLGHWFIRSMEPPVKLRLKTTKGFAPIPNLNPTQVRVDFLCCQEKLLVQLYELNGLHLTRMKVRSPFIKQLRYSLFVWLGILLAHERRHLWQAHEVVKQLR